MSESTESEQKIREQLLLLSKDKAPESSPEYEAELMQRVNQRKAELENSPEEDSFWDGFDEDEDDNFDHMSDISEDESEEKISRIHWTAAAASAPAAPSARPRIRRMWTTVASIAALLVFLFGGTALSRNSLHAPDPNPGNHISVVQTDGNTGADKSGIVDTSDYGSAPSEAALFFQDMWLFIKTAAPYIGGAAAIGLILLVLGRRKKSDS